jgi:nitrogen regulatory protein PII-like uncharacterized protein
MADLRKRIDDVRDALHEAGKDLAPADWKELLEEIATDIESHLEAVRDEAETAEGETL